MRVALLVVLLATLAMLTAGCPAKDQPPQLSEICTLDGHGGGDCSHADGSKFYRAPSEMLNYWATTQTDAANLVSWCYKIPTPVASAAVAQYVASYGLRQEPEPVPTSSPLPAMTFEAVEHE